MVQNNKLTGNSVLNEAQRRSLIVSLRLLEERLVMLQLMVDHGNYHGALFQLVVDLEEDQKKHLIHLIDEIHLKIDLLKENLNLSDKSVQFSSLIYSTQSYFWSVFCDQKSDKLSRYGPVSEELPPLLDPVIKQIIEALRDMVKLIYSKSKKKNKS